jgi:hypothetical protein
MQFNGNLLLWTTAHSQSEESMLRATFQKSKTAVLDYLANLLDVTNLIEAGKTAA